VSSTTARDYTQGTTTSTSDWKTTLNEIVRRVLSVARPDRIILFGSAATGQMTRDSDIDLLVVEPALANTHERRVEIRDAVGDVGYPVDVIVMRTERFEETKRWIGGIAYPANKYGRVIYEAA
jgi:predicted nucleotidyltransferase